MPKPTPIPTNYAGRRFRSRFEANVAQLIDLMGLQWKYEPRSFLIGPGLHYCPDFHVASLNLWVESRGYHSKSADEQVRLFLEYTRDRDEHYLVLSPDGCTYDGQPAYVRNVDGVWSFGKRGRKLTVKKSTILIDGMLAQEVVADE